MLLPVSMSFGREIKELSHTEIRMGLQVRIFKDLLYAWVSITDFLAM